MEFCVVRCCSEMLIMRERFGEMIQVCVGFDAHDSVEVFRPMTSFKAQSNHEMR